MAAPKLQIEQRVERLEKAVLTMAGWLVDAQTGFGVRDYEGIERILNGTETGTERASEDRPDAS